MSFISMIAAKYNIPKTELEELYAKSNESYTLTKGAQELIEMENIEVYSEIACGDDKRITLKQVRAHLKGSAPADPKEPKASKAKKSPKTVTTSKGFQVTPHCADNLKIRISDVRQYISEQAAEESESDPEPESDDDSVISEQYVDSDSEE